MKPKRSVTLTNDKASEMFIGGLCGLLQIAEKMDLGASVGASIMSTLNLALPKLTSKGVVAAYNRIGGDMPVEFGAKVLAHGARKPKRKARRR